MDLDIFSFIRFTSVMCDSFFLLRVFESERDVSNFISTIITTTKKKSSILEGEIEGDEMRIHAYVLERMYCLCCLATRVSANIFSVSPSCVLVRFCDRFIQEPKILEQREDGDF